jgi:AraC-like DNA-binding protein
VHVVYVLGAAQGLFLAAVLASREHGSVPNRLLAAVMAVFSVDLAMAAYHASGTDAAFPSLIGLDFPAGFLYGPLLYLYARTLTEPQRGLRRRDLLHFVPFALLVAYLLPFYALSGAEKLALLRAPDERLRVLAVANPLKLVHGLAYVAAVVAVLRRHRRRVADTFSSTEHVTLSWLRNLTVGAVALLATAGVLYAFEAREAVPVLGLVPGELFDDLTLLSLTAFVYAIGYLGLRQPAVFARLPAPAAAAPDAPARAVPSPEPEPAAEPEPAEPRPRYARSGMDEATAAGVEAALVALMEAERPYRRGDLTLQDLAGRLGVSPHNLTEVLNTRLGRSFYDFVNGYRVREAQVQLADPARANWTVLAVGMEAGFNSKSSFNAVFKRATGMTPSQYRAQHGGGNGQQAQAGRG